MSKILDTSRGGVCAILAVLASCDGAFGQVNSWTDPVSAAWESMDWSLGVLPDSSQSIMITNAGFKAIGISPSTRANFPDSMTVSNLTISAPTNAFNTLLLNFFGTGTPLEVLDECTIGTNAVVENLFSAFEVGGELFINGGQYIEQGGITIATNAGVEIFGGSMNLTNAVFEGAINLFDATVTQVDGQTSGGIGDDGTYNLLSGTLTGECLLMDFGEFNQYGGTNVGNIAFEEGSSGSYTMYNGLAVESDIMIGMGDEGSAIFIQYGGTVSTGSVGIGSGVVGVFFGTYELTNGTLQAGNLGVVSGGFKQSGGEVIATNEISVQGVPEFDYGPALYASFGISGGDLSCPGISLSLNGSFSQSGGTNSVSGDLSISGGGYGFSGGLLVTSNLDTSTIDLFLSGLENTVYSGAFEQSGGQLYVSNTLWNQAYCSISGGSVYAGNIIEAGFMSISNSALILNPGLFQFAGTLQLFGGSIENLGQMLLSNNSLIELMPGSHRLSFLNSSALAWSNGVALLVTNWNGSTNGGGSDQLLFGNSSSALTPAQLHQIVFANPAGFPAGNYAANILSGGEVVPLPNPVLSLQNMHGQLVLSWAGQPTLQSSTNIFGPYVDVPNASSPYTNNSSQGPYRFFRLRR